MLKKPDTCNPDGIKQNSRGTYIRFSSKEKATMGRYASENGVTKAVKHFKDKGAAFKIG